MLLSDFPQEIIENIADFLCFRDKISCSFVCKSWKRVFQDIIYSDISIRSHEALQDVMTPSQNSRHKYHEIGHLVRYLTIGHYWDITVEKIYALQKTFPNIKYLYFPIAPLDFGSLASLNIWGALTELHMHIVTSDLPIKENSLVEAIVCLPLLRWLAIHGQLYGNSIASFSVNNLETIHSHLKHLEHMKLGTNLLTLSDTDLERIPNVSPATTMKTSDIASDKTDYRWLCYLARKYPNLHTLNLKISYILPDIKEQKHNTKALFQLVPVSFQYLEELNLRYEHKIDGGQSLFMDKINFHNTPLKHVSIDVSGRYGAYSPDNLCDAPKIIVETFLERCSKAIESFELKYSSKHATPIDLTRMKNSLCNLVEVNINIPTSADIDTFLRAAPRLKYLELVSSDIKVEDELYSSERFELDTLYLYSSRITSDVLRFLSFHCRNLNRMIMGYVSVYGNFTTPGCQFIDMSYSRLQSLSLEHSSFIIKNSKRCPENLNITLITRPVDDITPKQEYDPDILPVNVGDTPFKTHNEWFYENDPGRMIRISGLQASYTEDFFSSYEENKRIAMEEARQFKKRKLSEISKQNFVFGYTKISLGYVSNYSRSTFLP